MIFRNIKAFMIDIDGVLYQGDRVIDGAVEAVNFLQKNFKCMLVTNTTRMSKTTLLRRLRVSRFMIKQEQLVTPVSVTIEYIKSLGGKKVFLIAEGDTETEFRNNGMELTEDADFVVVGLDRNLTYEKLNTAFLKIFRGAQLIAMHEDKLGPLGRLPSMSVGPFVRALEYATGKKAIVIGKPNPRFFQAALKQLGTKPTETVMIGDSITSDILGAKNVGLRTILVKTGNYSTEDLESSSIKPDVVVDSISAIPSIIG